MTTFVENLIRCPHCEGLSIASETASYLSGLTTYWTDGWTVPPIASAPALRCSHCSHCHLRSAFTHLGPLDYGDLEEHLLVLDLGPEPLRVFQQLRAAYGWQLGEVKTRLASLPVTLPGLRLVEDTRDLYRRLIRHNARCELATTTIRPPDPPERLHAPLAMPPQCPSDLSGLIVEGSVEELPLRLYAYQLSNHPFREPTTPWVGVMQRLPFESANASALDSLLGTGNAFHRLLRANIARESGDLGGAAALLRSSVPEDFHAWHLDLLELVRVGVTRVSRLFTHAV